MAGRPPKEKIVSFKVDGESYKEFCDWTKSQGLTVSSALRNFMATKIKEHKEEAFRLAERAQQFRLLKGD